MSGLQTNNQITSIANLDTIQQTDEPVSDALHTYKSNPDKNDKIILNSLRFWSIFFHSSCFTFFSGYVTAEFNTMLNHLPHIYGWDDADVSLYQNLCNSLPMLGAASIAIWSGDFAQKLGRRKSLMLFSVVMIIGSILTMFQNTPLLLVGRFLQGSTFAIFSTVSPLYSQEVLVTEYRAKSGTLISGCQGLGVLTAFIMGFGLPSNPEETTKNKYFFVPLALPAILMFIHLLFFIFVFKDETPTFYLLQKNDKAKALQFFEKLYGPQYVEREMEAILAVKKENEEVDKQKKISICDLFNQKYRYRTLLALELNVTSVYTAVSVLSVYSTQIFENSYNTSTSTLLSISTTLGDIFLPSLSNKVVQYFGKKNSCIYGSFGLILCECIFSGLGFAGQNKPMAFFIIAHRLIFSLTVGPFNWSYPYEICPAEGLGIYIMQFYVLMYISLYTFPLLASSFSLEAAFLVYAGIMLISTLINMKYVLHIDNCTVKDIQDLFDLRKIKTMVNLSDYNTSPSHRRYNRRLASKPPTIVLNSLAHINTEYDDQTTDINNYNKNNTEFNFKGKPLQRQKDGDQNSPKKLLSFASPSIQNLSPQNLSPLKRGQKRQQSAIILQRVIKSDNLEVVQEDTELKQQNNNVSNTNKNDVLMSGQKNFEENENQYQEQQPIRKISKTMNIALTSQKESNSEQNKQIATDNSISDQNNQLHNTSNDNAQGGKKQQS